MQQLIDGIVQLYKSWKGEEPLEIDVLPQSGSDRRYFRLHIANGDTLIATSGNNIKENEVFISPIIFMVKICPYLKYLQ
jgi:hypothetical protein